MRGREIFSKGNHGELVLRDWAGHGDWLFSGMFASLSLWKGMKGGWVGGWRGRKCWCTGDGEGRESELKGNPVMRQDSLGSDCNL